MLMKQKGTDGNVLSSRNGLCLCKHGGFTLKKLGLSHPNSICPPKNAGLAMIFIGSKPSNMMIFGQSVDWFLLQNLYQTKNSFDQTYQERLQIFPQSNGIGMKHLCTC